MSKPSKNGRIPASARNTSESSDFSLNTDDFNLLNIDQALKDELASKGLAYRWCNVTDMKSRGGVHRSGWRPYRVATEAAASNRGTLDFHFGVSPEGYYVRGDLILCTMPKEQNSAHKARVARKTAVMAASNDVAEAFKEKAREAGAKVHDGYEEN